jgi:hypothetical protein
MPTYTLDAEESFLVDNHPTKFQRKYGRPDPKHIRDMLSRPRIDVKHSLALIHNIRGHYKAKPVLPTKPKVIDNVDKRKVAQLF